MASLVDLLKESDVGKPGVSRRNCQQIVADLVRDYLQEAGAVTNTEVAKALNIMVSDPDYGTSGGTSGRTVFWAKTGPDWHLNRFVNATLNPFLAQLNYARLCDAAHEFLSKRSTSPTIRWGKGYQSSITSQRFVYYRDEQGLALYIQSHFKRHGRVYRYQEDVTPSAAAGSCSESCRSQRQHGNS